MNNCETQKAIKAYYDFVQSLSESVSPEQIEIAEEMVSKINHDFLKSRHIEKYVEWSLKCLKAQEIQKAKRHILVASRNSYPYANDYPAEVGEDAYVIRYEHGFMDGKMKVKIVSRCQSKTGVWSYCAKVYKEDEKTFEPDYVITINHTRDLIRV